MSVTRMTRSISCINHLDLVHCPLMGVALGERSLYPSLSLEEYALEKWRKETRHGKLVASWPSIEITGTYTDCLTNNYSLSKGLNGL